MKNANNLNVKLLAFYFNVPEAGIPTMSLQILILCHSKVVLYQLSYFRIVIVMGVQIYTHFFIPKISLIFFQQIFNLVKFHKGFNWR